MVWLEKKRVVDRPSHIPPRTFVRMYEYSAKHASGYMCTVRSMHPDISVDGCRTGCLLGRGVAQAVWTREELPR